MDTSNFKFPDNVMEVGLSTLCVHCASLSASWARLVANWGESLSHWDTVAQLQNSAESCALCAQFAKDLRPVHWENAREFGGNLGKAGKQLRGGNILVEKAAKNEFDHWVLLLSFSRDGEGEEGFNPLDSISGKMKGVSWSRVCLLRAEMRETTDESSLNTKDALPLAKQWLNRCLDSHSMCRTTPETTPTRLLGLGADGTHLSLATNMPEGTEYATLSHCWGKAHHLTLKKDNLAQFKVSIIPDGISKTFQEAIYIALQLGISYLWIDSLCIIQDDIEDWEFESSRMAAVYGGSILNIAATGARDGTIGCFFERPPIWRCEITLPSLTHGGSHVVRYICVARTTYASKSRTPMPLLERGWALQERIMSPRTLNLGFPELSYACFHSTNCETFPVGIPACLNFDERSQFRKQPTARMSWEQVVVAYAACDLTYSRDKLVAISGLARLAQKKRGGEYVAGLWREKLEVQLCWMGWAKSRGEPVALYRAPSWSWAALDREVRFLPEVECSDPVLLIHILDVQVAYANAGNPFGQVLAGVLSVSCKYLLHAIVDWEGGLPHLSRSSNLPPLPQLFLNGEVLSAPISLDYVRNDAELYTTNRQNIILLPIIEVVVAEFRGSSSFFKGILLEKTVSVGGQYRRIGWFMMPSCHNICEDPECWVKEIDIGLSKRTGNKFSSCVTII